MIPTMNSKEGKKAAEANPEPGPEAAKDAGEGAGEAQKVQGEKKTRQLTNKPQDFQVRVKVVQARQLQGSNIHAVARITVFQQTQQTRVQKSTNTPYWDEAFFFNVNTAPAELLNENINFQVFNSKLLRADALIGSFKCDMGLVYDEPQHALLNKWLLLGDPEDTMAGAKGYLKVSVVIIGPGDEAPSMKVTEAIEDEDIESNLLRPPGVRHRSAMFVIKAYRAEDIPRMDTDVLETVKKVFGLGGDKDSALVDPYFVCSFAGKEVKSKTIEGCSDPEWNQELRIGLQFPSMCERIKFQIRDWDRVSADDAIGTFFLNMSNISSSGDSGYLPTFGPCFINFYGSIREYSDLDAFQDLNEGKGVGVAYRGRALIELTTVMGETPETPVVDIDAEDLTKLQKFMRRRKYRVHASFKSANMVSVTDSPVMFEISIGNYGNKLDENVSPTCSTTQRTYPVFDGNKYYFLPWGATVPSLLVECSFEDISWRLEALNLLLKIVSELEANIERMSIAVKAMLPVPELAQLLISLLDHLIQECSKEIPEPQPGVHSATELDQQLAKNRQTVLANIISMATNLKTTATDVGEAIAELDTYLSMLKAIAVEPQNSMPDVVVWMISDQKRIAFHRVPAYSIFFCPDPDYAGKDCGKLQTIQLQFPTVKERPKEYQIPAVLRMRLWLGLQMEEEEWKKVETEGELAVFAETYENQVSILGKWTNKGPTMTRPAFSDSDGKTELPKKDFHAPEGWKWDGNWFVNPEASLRYGRDAGHQMFVEDLYECQSRTQPGAAWKEARLPWTDAQGEERESLLKVKLPEGWRWEDDWQIDLTKAVDEEGFEYCVNSTVGGYGPVERTYHMARRRRWIRTRKHVTKTNDLDEMKMLKKNKGWVYAPLFHLKFHATERVTDLVRRRRWHRKLKAVDETATCIFTFVQEPKLTFDDVLDTIQPKKVKMSRWRKKQKNQKNNKQKNLRLAAPSMFLTINESEKYQLRAYVYSARNLLAADSTGLSDPYAHVCFLTHSAVTETLHATLCPTWDQTLILGEIEIYGNAKAIQKDPPLVYIELFDQDTFGMSEYLGRTTAVPMVKLSSADTRSSLLEWIDIRRRGKPGGEMLAAFELLRITAKGLPNVPPKRGTVFQVPNGVRPEMQRTAIEVLCWGVRNMKKYHLTNVISPSVQFECGGHILSSSIIKNTKKNPNFDTNVLFFDVMLPKEDLYTPPVNIVVHDNRNFGRRPNVGVHVIKSYRDFRSDPKLANKAPEMKYVKPAGPPPEITITQPQDITRAVDHAPEVAYAPEVAIEIPEDQQPQKSLWETFVDELNVPELEVMGYKVDLKAWLLQINPLSVDPFGRTRTGTVTASQGTQLSELVLEELDWWSKYYASRGEYGKCKLYLKMGYPKIKVYNTELEKVEGHNNFTDFCQTFPLTRGKEDEEEESGSTRVVGEFKGTFRVYPLPEDPSQPLPHRILSDLPPSTPEECVVRVYVVECCDLHPSDSNGLADPYIEIVLGKKKVNNRDTYVPNSLNTVIGRWFELKAIVPVEKDLIVRVVDYDFLFTDDLIGETVIDLENRFLSKWRATCGIAPQYYTSGVNEWRDSRTPRELLQEYCRKNQVEGPHFLGPTAVQVGMRIFNIADFENKDPCEEMGPTEERLALHVLNCFPVVKEHVENRPLFNDLRPGIEQGRIKMWVDIFPKSLGPPGPTVEIKPRKTKKFVLRCIVWNTEDVILEETSITGEQMSDIYVVGWMAGIDKKQETDVHYRSLDGTGNFNWRFVFPFDYLVAEEVMVVSRQEHLFSLDKIESHLAPKLIIQIWDNDKFSADDFLGVVELDLNRMPQPAKSANTCDLDILPDPFVGRRVPMSSLFEVRRLKGFWPCYNDETGVRELTGKVELELELLTAAEAELSPAGLGREEPNANPTLDPPKRPETSFSWFMSPCKTLQYVIWRHYKWVIISSLASLLIALLFILFIYAFPAEFARLIMNRLGNPTPNFPSRDDLFNMGFGPASHSSKRHAVDDMRDNRRGRSGQDRLHLMARRANR